MRRHGGVEYEIDAGLEFRVGCEVGERFGEAVDVGEFGFAECAQVAHDALPQGLVGAGTAADGEAADFPHGVTPDESDEDALGLNCCAAGETRVHIRIERGFGDSECGVDAVWIQDNEREGVGMAVAEFTELFGENDQTLARRNGAVRK